jgi:hypothetical protein
MLNITVYFILFCILRLFEDKQHYVYRQASRIAITVFRNCLFFICYSICILIIVFCLVYFIFLWHLQFTCFQFKAIANNIQWQLSQEYINYIALHIQHRQFNFSIETQVSIVKKALNQTYIFPVLHCLGVLVQLLHVACTI